MNTVIEFKGTKEDARFVLEIANVLMSGNERMAALVRAGAPIRYTTGGAAVTSINTPLDGTIKRKAARRP